MDNHVNRDLLTRRQLLKLAPTVLALPVFASVFPASVQAAPPQDLKFLALYQGSPVGTHSVSFLRDDDYLVVTSHVDIAIKVLFFTAFRFEHKAVETWRSRRLVSVESTTDDNGTDLTVSGHVTHDGFRIDGTGGPFLADGALLTTNTLWDNRLIHESRIIDVQNGGESGLVVKPLGTELVDTPQGPVIASRFRIITPDYAGSLFFDADGRWVKSLLERQGEILEYALIS